MMCIPSHVGVRGNKRADRLACDTVKNGIEWHAPVCPSDFLHFSRVILWRVAGMLVIWEDLFALFSL
jgi:hypothetical protein